MHPQIDAIFDGGVFKPLVPLSLPDKSRVRLTVDTPVDNGSPLKPTDEWEHSLVATGQDCGVTLSDADLSSEELYE
jgi:predicted DNA-binding antitoxin AbrB/MazE fold protein